MMIMPANNTSGIVHYLSGRHPDKIGLLISPNGWRVAPFYMPYALDNGCFVGWDEVGFYEMLRKAKLMRHKPLWVVVPDVVGDAEATLKMWDNHKDKVGSFGFPLAFACQDGMTPSDVPAEAFCAFIGGTTEWKLSEAKTFKGVCDWLHIGRVNGIGRILWADDIGADSIDGTGFFRDKGKKYWDFIKYFEGDNQQALFA